MTEIVEWANERNKLKCFLAERGYEIGEVQKQLLPQYFSGFIYSLNRMGQKLNQAGLLAQMTKDPELTGEILGHAKIQKDNVYHKLILALGTPTEQSDLGDGNIMTIIDVSKGGLKYMERIWEEPQLKALKDYVVQKYQRGINKCEKILLS